MDEKGRRLETDLTIILSTNDNDGSRKKHNSEHGGCVTKRYYTTQSKIIDVKCLFL